MAAASEKGRVFLSHSHSVADKELYRHVARRLQDAGLEPVLLKGKAAPGERLLKSVRQAIHQSQEVLFLMTPAALQNKWPLVELGAAEALQKRVLVVLVGLSRKQLPVPFHDYEPVPFDQLEEAIEKMAQRLVDCQRAET
jgi:hypothetical protein